MKHKHCEVIKAWADGAQIQYVDSIGDTRDTDNPEWIPEVEYLVKPPKPRTTYGYESLSYGVQRFNVIELTEEVKAALNVADIEYGEEG